MDAIQKSLSEKIIGLLTETKMAMNVSVLSDRLNINPYRVGQTIRNLEDKGKVIFNDECKYILTEYKDYSNSSGEDRARAQARVNEKARDNAELVLCMERSAELKAKIKANSNQRISDDTNVPVSVVRDMVKGG